jgi:4-amino-4-deoxy-L-arabinose transferase-like glycosyltransferase
VQGSNAATKRHVALLALVLVLAAALRSIGLGSQSLWADEALTPVLANWPTGDMLLLPTDPTPFLYYFLHKLFIPAGAGVEAVRSISLVAGILSVAAIYWVGRLALGRSAGLLAAALLAVWPAHVDYSQEARAYSLLFLLTLLSAAGLLWWFRASGKEDGARIGPVRARHAALALFATATTLSFYTHLVSIFWIPLALQILISLTSRKRSKAHIVEAGVAVAAMALFAVPGIIRLVREVATPDAFHWLAQQGPGGFLSTTADLLLPAGLWANPLVDALGLRAEAKAVIAIGLVAGLAWLLVRARRLWPDFPTRQPATVPVALAFLALPLLIWLFGYVARPLFMPRTILFAIPGMILLIVAAISAVRSERGRIAASAIAIAAFLLPSLLHGTTREKEDWRGANAALAGHVRPGDLILVCPGWKYPALRHAAAQQLPAPVMIPLEPEPILEEQAFGSDPQWERTYFQSVTEPVMRSWIGGTARPHPRGHIGLARGASLWLVGSECSSGELASLARRFSMSGGWIPIWQSPATPDHAGISVGRYVLAAGVSEPLMLPPRP